MLSADTLTTLTSFSTNALTRAINLAGYPEDRFTKSKFLGLTNGGQFCYSVTYKDTHMDKEVVGKVFLSYNPVEGTVTADY